MPSHTYYVITNNHLSDVPEVAIMSYLIPGDLCQALGTSVTAGISGHAAREEQKASRLCQIQSSYILRSTMLVTP
jgi:hypothetical protein